jgi:hypothetical protein
MAKGASDEIDTIFEAAEGKRAANVADQVTSLSADISLGSELESSKAEVTEAAPLPEKTFTFPNFPRQVYCTLSGIRLRLIQTGEGSGIAFSPSPRPATAGAATWPPGPIGCSPARSMTRRTPRSATSISALGTTAAASISSS